MNEITVKLEPDGRMTIDLGGELDKGCCGCEAEKFHDALAGLGVELKLQGVHCRLPVSERVRAKLQGTCKWRIANPLRVDHSLAEGRLSRG